MTITHHPSDATLGALASGALDEARGLVVATHLSLCAPCRRAARTFEHVAGALLENIEPTGLRPDALEQTLARLGEVEAAVSGPDLPSASDLPAPLSQFAVGSWRWIGPGVRWRSVDLPSEGGVRVFMLKAAPRTRLSRHRHTGTEWTCVLQGAFRHDLGRYGAGDFDEADETVEHNPVVEDGVACICLIALQGNIQLQSRLGRLIAPLIRL